MKIPEKLFHIGPQHLGETKIFSFHLYVFNPQSKQYSAYLFANSPLTNDKEQFLQFIVKKGGELAVDMKQKKTFLKNMGLKEEDVPSLKPREIHPLEIEREKKLQELEKKREALGPFKFVEELEKALVSEDFTPIIHACRDEVRAFSVKISPTVSLASYFGERFLNSDSYLGRIVALSFWLAKNCNVNDQSSLGDLVCAAFMAHLGMTQIDSSIIQRPTLELPDIDKKRLHKHPGLSHHLILKSKAPISERCKQIIFQHHERFDGSGYPSYKRGEFIDPLALILGSIAHIQEYSSGKITGQQQSITQTLRNLKNKTFTPGLEFEFGDTIYENLISLVNLNKISKDDNNSTAA